MTDENKNIENNQEEKQNRQECNKTWWKKLLFFLVLLFIIIFILFFYEIFRKKFNDTQCIINANKLKISTQKQYLKNGLYYIGDLNIDRRFDYVLLPISEKEVLILGGHLNYTNSIEKINIESNTIMKYSKSNFSSYRDVFFHNNKFILFSNCGIEEYDIKTNLFKIKKMLCENNHLSYLYNPIYYEGEIIVFVHSNNEGMELIYDINNNSIKSKSNYFQKYNKADLTQNYIQYKDKILFYDIRKLPYYQHIDKTNKLSSFEYSFSKNSFIPKSSIDYDLGFNSAIKINDENFFIFGKTQLKERTHNNKKFVYEKAKVYNAEKHKIITQIMPAYTEINSEYTVVDFVKLSNNKILILENGILRQIFDIKNMRFEKLKEQYYFGKKNLGYKMLNISEDKVLITDGKKVWVYKY